MEHTEQFIEMIEKALGFKLYGYQRKILKGKDVQMPSGRATGKTLTSMLVLLTKYDQIDEPIELVLSNFVNGRYFSWYTLELRELRRKLVEKGIPCREIVLKRFG
ncbi:hypothetical protein [Enterococcus gilvus]|uniref:hypothetical protein n=1 Tax=Enterococcus gilvus TaxID=160453 RepID=UPI001C8CEBFC|nr:hypothetical protein [Enterococcus gilvus]MBX8938504.1 hypothetical protein [Enterococcus gilvus]